MVTVGVLSLQGAVTPHLRMLQQLSAETIRVVDYASLSKCDRLIIPGGESTTMLKLIDSNQLWEPLNEFISSKPCWGTCAGAILLAKKVSNPDQKSFQKIDIEAVRNAYGSQRESFKATISAPSIVDAMEVDFIRAPKLLPLHSSVEVLATYHNEDILLRQGHILVSSFHCELGTNPRLHEYFIGM